MFAHLIVLTLHGTQQLPGISRHPIVLQHPSWELLPYFVCPSYHDSKASFYRLSPQSRAVPVPLFQACCPLVSASALKAQFEIIFTYDTFYVTIVIGPISHKNSFLSVICWDCRTAKLLAGIKLEIMRKSPAVGFQWKLSGTKQNEKKRIQLLNAWRAVRYYCSKSSEGNISRKHICGCVQTNTFTDVSNPTELNAPKIICFRLEKLTKRKSLSHQLWFFSIYSPAVHLSIWITFQFYFLNVG